MVKKLVSIVIVTKDRRQLTLDCLASVLKLNYPRFEVILVDNGSIDSTPLAVKKRFPQVKIIEAGENLGVNAAKNLGQKIAKGEYILFLDSDTLVDKNLLTELVSLAEIDSQIGLVCPKIYYEKPKNFIWYAGAKINLLTSKAENIGCNQKDRGQFDFVSETQFAPTAYLVTRKTAQKLKGHEESFFMSYGESDYGFRVQKAGLKVVFCPWAKLWHQLKMKENIKSIRALGYNLPLRPYYFARNRVIFMKRNATDLNFLIFMLVFFPLFTFYIAAKIIIFGGVRQFLKPHLQGSFDGIKYVFTGKVNNYWR